MKRGEVWWASLPSGRRPVVVLTRDAAIPLLGSITVAPTTTRIRGIPTEVPLSRSDGMPTPSVVTLDNVQIVPKKDLRRRISSLSGARLEQICEALSYALDC